MAVGRVSVVHGTVGLRGSRVILFSIDEAQVFDSKGSLCVLATGDCYGRLTGDRTVLGLSRATDSSCAPHTFWTSFRKINLSLHNSNQPCGDTRLPRVVC